MKLKELVLETTAPPGFVMSPSGLLIPMWPSAGLAARTGSTTPRPRAERESGKRAAALTKKRNIRQAIDKLYMGGIPGKGGKNIINPRMQAMLDSKYKIIRGAARGIRLLQLIGYIGFAEEWWKDRAALEVMRDLPSDDPQYAEMHITDEEYDMYTRRLAEEFAVKVAASAIMPGLLRWVIRSLTMARFFVALFSIPNPVTAVASIGLLIGSELAMMKFQSWLNTESGKLAVSKAVAWAIDPTLTFFWDAGPGKLWAMIKSFVGAEEEKPAAKDKPAAKETPAKDKPVSTSDTDSTPATPTATTANKPAGQAAQPSKVDWSTDDNMPKHGF
jgi:hypothetical protein